MADFCQVNFEIYSKRSLLLRNLSWSWYTWSHGLLSGGSILCHTATVFRILMVDSRVELYDHHFTHTCITDGSHDLFDTASQTVLHILLADHHILFCICGVLLAAIDSYLLLCLTTLHRSNARIATNLNAPSRLTSIKRIWRLSYCEQTSGCCKDDDFI